LSISWKSPQGRLDFSCGCKLNYIHTSTVKCYVIFQVKNTWVKSCVLCHGICHLHLVCLSTYNFCIWNYENLTCYRMYLLQMPCGNIHNWCEQFDEQKATKQALVWCHWCLGVQAGHQNCYPTHTLVRVLEK